MAFQETKAKPDQMMLDFWTNEGYTGFHNTATKPGYSSVSVFSKKKPKKVKIGIDHPLFDSEGRAVGLEFEKFYFLNLYFPSGTTGDIRQNLKMEFLTHIFEYSKKLQKQYKSCILCGDVNIAHTEMDIHNPKGNQKTSGFLPEEREWMDKFLKSGWVDVHRNLHPTLVEYSWWTYRFQARAQNKGWRIDYFFITKNLAKNLSGSKIHSGMQASDHAPIEMEIKI